MTVKIVVSALIPFAAVSCFTPLVHGETAVEIASGGIYRRAGDARQALL